MGEITLKEQWPPQTKSLKRSLNEEKWIFFPKDGLELLYPDSWLRGLLWGWG